MNTILSLADCKTLVDRELRQLFRRHEVQAQDISDSYAELIRSISQFALRGGKRLRAYLCYLAFRGRGGKNMTHIMRHMLCIELCHIYLLIHDDFMDRDTVRYGGPTIGALYTEKYGNKHIGNSLEVLAGDVVYGMAMSCLTNTSMVQAVSSTMFQTIGGQVLDILGEGGEVARYKTAEYSFHLPLVLGFGVDREDIEQCAVSLGIAYQLRDDLLGTFGTEAQLGKSVLSDLRQGKNTLLFQFAKDHANSEGVKLLNQVHGNVEATYNDLEKVRNLYEETGAKTYVEVMCNQHSQVALQQLESLNLSTEVAKIMEKLIHDLTKREK